MKGIVRLFNILVALCVMALVLLLFWFLFAKYLHGYSAAGTISYMLGVMQGWLDSVKTWLAAVGKGA